MRIALRFNDLVRRGEIGPVIIGRDHHDVSGTDSPYRETANIYDGSNVMADMAFHCWAGNAARGMTLVVAVQRRRRRHRAGRSTAGSAWCWTAPSGWTRIIRSAVEWDVMGGVARRAWARNEAAIETCAAYNRTRGGSDHVTLPYLADERLVGELVDREFDT